MHPSTRRRLTQSQTHALVTVFDFKTHPSREERALLAAELGMCAYIRVLLRARALMLIVHRELKAVNAWFQNKRRSLKKTWSGTSGWSKGSLPENKHVRPVGGPKTLPPSDSALSLDRVASSHELPYKAKSSSATRPAPCPPVTPRRRVPANRPTKVEIWEHIPSSPPTRPSSPGLGEPLLAMEPCTKRFRTLEWACANARAGRRATIRAKAAAARPPPKGNDDVPMLVLDGPPRGKSPSPSDDTETSEDDEDDEAITPNVSTELLPSFLLPDAPVGPTKGKKAGQGEDMEAAMALLGFMGPAA